MTEEELREIIGGIISIRLWLQSSMTTLPSQDQQLIAIHNLGKIEGTLTRNLEQVCTQSADDDSR